MNSEATTEDRPLPAGNSIEFLYSLETFGIKMDLDNIRSLMEFSGDPHRRLRAIHVAGTNGKGSTCAAIASVLQAQGYTVGLYTSPHIMDFRERIRINGVMISEQDLEKLTEYFREEIIALRATFFEATTAIMFKYFADSKVDFGVVETGLGGRLDATNVIDPLVSVITGIGLDHTRILGGKLEQIAREKAGIIKRGRPAVVNVRLQSLRDVFSETASFHESKLSFVEDSSSVDKSAVGIDSCSFDARVLRLKFEGIKLDLGGPHQIENALTALTAIVILEQGGIDISKRAIYEGLANIRRNTGHRGRLEVISRKPLVILDVAHNPDGIRAVLKGLSPLTKGRKGTVLFGAMRDKDAASMLCRLRERFRHVILTQLKTERSLGVSELNKLCDAIKLRAEIFGNSSDALRAALSQIDNDSFLLITGSHYLAGEVLPAVESSVANLESL